MCDVAAYWWSMKSLFRRARLVMMLACLAIGAPENARAETIRIGVLAYLGAKHSVEAWGATARAIEAGLPGSQVQLIPLDHDGLEHAIDSRSIDFVITNPGHYVELEVAHGISRIATLESSDPVASTIVVRRDRADIQTLADLRGKRIGTVGNNAFGGFQVAQRVLAEAGLDTATDIDRFDAVGFPMTRVVDAVINKKVDAGIIRGCVMEQLEAAGTLARGALRVLSPRPSSLTTCEVSSRVYPNWPFAKLRDTPAALAKKVVIALLAYTPPPGAPGWTVPVNYRSVHELFRELRVGPYKSLRHPGLLELIARYWQWLVAIGVGLIAWVWHVLRVERLVRRRTSELDVVNLDLRREIEKRRRIEEREALQRKELDHAARLLTLGEMAAGLAHELNQPLAAITNYADGCELRLRAGPVDAAELVDATRLIRDQAHRAAQVIQRTRAFVRKREPVHTTIDLGELVSETVEFFEGLARRAGATVDLAQARDLFHVSADRILLQQVLLNLLQNALDAMAETSPGERKIEVALFRRDNGACIRVSDRGCGIPDDIKARLFEPFFTTKPNGLGLGLALCRSIIDEHHGRLVIEDNPGGGTIMQLWLPLVAAEQI